MTTTGVILGKFMPPHLGHVALIRTASHLVDKLTIILSTSDSDEIEPAIRQEWVEALFPQARVIVCNNGKKPLPSDDKRWAKIIRGFHPAPIDRVIGSEAYLVRLAKDLNAQHFILDPMWMAYPANSEDIRKDPFANWESIPGYVRPYFQKRLTMVGPESTGKSYMADFLAKKFGGPYVPEYGRPYERFRKKGKYRAEELHFIADGHVAHRKTLAMNAGPILFEDTDVLLTAVWAEMLLGKSLPDLEERIELPDHYLLLDADVEWEEDPLRYYAKQEIREEFFVKIKRKLDKFGADYTLISGGWKEREEEAIEVVGEMLAAREKRK